jgi:hypothetical protein
MTRQPNKWYFPPSFGFALVLLVYILAFSGALNGPPTLLSRVIDFPARYIMDLVRYCSLPPHGDAGFIWCIISPGIAWFLIGTIFGYLWFAVDKIRNPKA